MKKLAVLVAASIMAMAALAYGEMGDQGKGPGMKCDCNMGGQMMEMEHGMSIHLMALNLDEQQKAFIREVKSRMKKETIKKTADMRIARIELKELLFQDPVEMKAVEAKIKQMEMIRTDMHLSHIRAMEECKAKLTPEQRKKLREMIEAGPMREGRGMKHDRGHGMKGKKAGTKQNK